jgi:hypothetical protein
LKSKKHVFGGKKSMGDSSGLTPEEVDELIALHELSTAVSAFCSATSQLSDQTAVLSSAIRSLEGPLDNLVAPFRSAAGQANTATTTTTTTTTASTQ